MSVLPGDIRSTRPRTTTIGGASVGRPWWSCGSATVRADHALSRTIGLALANQVRKSGQGGCVLLEVGTRLLGGRYELAVGPLPGAGDALVVGGVY